MMGVNPYRIIRLSFWNDKKIVEQFSAEDRYFFLYLLTNPHTTQLGIYTLVPRVAAFELGYSVEAVSVLLDRFQNRYDIIRYSPETSEIAIKNFLIHNIARGGTPVFDLLVKELTHVQSQDLIEYIYNNLSNHDNLNDTVLDLLEYIEKERYIDIKNINTKNNNQRIVDDTLTNRYRISADEAEAFFEECWKAYPKKKGKGSVKLATKRKLMKDVGKEQMLRCIERYKEYTNGWDDKYIKDGSTFFNSGYVDYLDNNVEDSGSKASVASEPNNRVRSDGRVWQ